MLKPIKKFLYSSDKFWYYSSIFLSIGFLLVIFSDIADTSFSRYYFNSDMLYDPVIFKDIFIDKTGLKVWHLNAAPNFFPDMFLYFIYMGITGDFIISNFLFSFTQYLAIIFLVFFLFRQTNKEKAWMYASVFNYLMFLFLLLPIFTNRVALTFQLISISYHIGSFIMFLLSLNLLIHYLKKRNYYILLILSISVIIGTFNDRLYISQFIFSIIPLVFLFYSKTHRRKLLLPVGVILLSMYIGLRLFKILQSVDDIEIIDTGFKMYNFENLSNSWHTFWNYLGSLLTKFSAEMFVIIAGILALSLTVLYLIMNYKSILVNPHKEEYLTTKYLLIIIAVYIPVTILTPVINGAFVSTSIIRFNIMAFFIGLMLLPIILLVWEEMEIIVTKQLKYLLPVLTSLFLILFIYNVSASNFRKGLTSYFNFYPEEAQILDKLKLEYDLKFGIGDYWKAKYLTMFSKNDLRIYTVFAETLRPFYHSTNENWYHSGGKGKYKDPVFNFIYRRPTEDSEKFIRIFGEQMDTIYSDLENNMVIIKLPDFQIDRETREIVFLDLE